MRAPFILSPILAAVLLSSPCLALAQAEPAAAAPAPAALLTGEVTVPTATPAPAAQESYQSHRELNGHEFMPSAFVLTPFSATSFGMTLLAGGGTASTPEYEIIQTDPGPPPTIQIVPTGTYRDSPFAAIGPALSLSVRIVEWVAIRGALLGTIFSGTDGKAVLTVGSSMNVSGSMGVTAGLQIIDSLRLAATFDYRYSPSFNILVVNGIIDAINSGIISGGVFQKVETHTLATGLAGAWAPFPFLGLTLNLQYLNTERSGSSGQGGLVFAGLADFDLLPLVSFLPIGVTFVYQLSSPLGSEGVYTTTDYAGGLFYTGRKDLALGLEVDLRKFRLLTGQEVSSATIANLTMRYYW